MASFALSVLVAATTAAPRTKVLPNAIARRCGRQMSAAAAAAASARSVSFASPTPRPRFHNSAGPSAASQPPSAPSPPYPWGDSLPDASLSYFDSDGELRTVSVSDLTKGKKAIFFAVPGAFTPTCSQKHLPGFVEKAAELRAKGVDTIACVSVNDAFVMKAWKKDLKIGDEVLLLSDGNLEFTRALGVELDLSDKPVGLGLRSRRYSLLAEDGIVKVLHLEEGGAFTLSSAEQMLSSL